MFVSDPDKSRNKIRDPITEEKLKKQKKRKIMLLITFIAIAHGVFLIIWITKHLLAPGRIETCKKLPPKTTLAEFRKKFGPPIQEKSVGDYKWVSFKSDPIALGPIRVRVHRGKNKVVELKCVEGGASEWVADSKY